MALLKTFQEEANKTSLNKRNTNHLFKLMNLRQMNTFIRLWGGESKFEAPWIPSWDQWNLEREREREERGKNNRALTKQREQAQLS